MENFQDLEVAAVPSEWTSVELQLQILLLSFPQFFPTDKHLLFFERAVYIFVFSC